jgi:hypothetical protein
MAEPTLYERIGGIYAIAAVVDHFSDQLRVAVRADPVGAVVHKLVAGAIEPRRQHPQAMAIPTALANPCPSGPVVTSTNGRHASLRMAGAPRGPLAEPLQLLQWQVVAG